MVADRSRRASVLPGILKYRASAMYAAINSYGTHGSGVAAKEKPFKRSRPAAKANLWKKILFGRRIATFVAEGVYSILAMQITVQMVLMANGIEKLSQTYTFDESAGMRKWIGTTTIRQSPLFQQTIKGRLNDSLYLHVDDPPSFQPCTQLTMRQQEIYSDGWLRSLYSKVIAGAAYNLTFLTNRELIVPVVDCTAASILANDTSRSKFYFLMRDNSDPNDVHLLTLALAVQEYWIRDETQVGSAAVASMAFISDLRSKMWITSTFCHLDIRMSGLISRFMIIFPLMHTIFKNFSQFQETRRMNSKSWFIQRTDLDSASKVRPNTVI